MNDNYFDELEARLTDPNIPLGAPSEVKTGETAAATGRAFLIAEYGSEEALNAAMRRGRPRVGSEKGVKSPVVRGAITSEDYEALQVIVHQTGRTQAELVREAVHQLIHHRAAS